MKTVRLSLRLLLLCLFVGYFGCAPQTRVDLLYQPSGVRVSPCQKSISVVTFKDQWGQNVVGETQRGVPIRTDDSVSSWISRAFYDELQRNGCRVEYHDSGSTFDTDVTLTGNIKDLKVIQMSHTEYDARLQLNVVLNAAGQQVFIKEYVSKLTKKTFPSAEVPGEVLTELLQGLIREALSDMGDHLK